MKIERVGVVGCGVMGSGIAQICAMKGYGVIVCEKNDTQLEKGMNAVRHELFRLEERGKISTNQTEMMYKRVRGATNLEALHSCDLVIEAIPEDLGLKQQLFREMDGICSSHTILASNTSVLPVIAMARSTQRPDKVVGTHFLTPAPVIRLLEIVRTLLTGEETLRDVKEFGVSLGKRVVVSQDRPGFIVNRVLTSILFNGVRLLEEGVADKASIDAAVKDGLGLPMGPFALMDLIGLDTLVLGSDALYRELNDPQYQCPVLIRRMVAAGWLGRKSGKGFFEYGSQALNGF